MPVSGEVALQRLLNGNHRFRTETMAEAWASLGPAAAEMAAGQKPFAAVLGCSDSRVPVEVIFGQGPGQLFVVRVAGNVVAPTQLGSIEFAVRQLGVKLVMVLGHSGCGAVAATLQGSVDEPDYLRALTSRIAEAIHPVMDDPTGEPEARLEQAVRMNVEASRRLLLSESDALAEMHASGELWIASAVYDLATRSVMLLEEGGVEAGTRETEAP